jgi:hypothetical protein
MILLLKYSKYSSQGVKSGSSITSIDTIGLFCIFVDNHRIFQSARMFETSYFIFFYSCIININRIASGCVYAICLSSRCIYTTTTVRKCVSAFSVLLLFTRIFVKVVVVYLTTLFQQLRL